MRYTSMCKRCKECKSQEDYYYSKGGKRSTYCKECHKDIIKRSRRKDPKSSRSNSIRWRKNNPEKIKAHGIFQNAVNRDDIIRPAICSGCGVKCRPDGHHEDYSKPLEVTWLCRKCHAGLHQEIFHTGQQ